MKRATLKVELTGSGSPEVARGLAALLRKLLSGGSARARTTQSGAQVTFTQRSIRTMALARLCELAEQVMTKTRTPGMLRLSYRGDLIPISARPPPEESGWDSWETYLDRAAAGDAESAAHFREWFGDVRTAWLLHEWKRGARRECLDSLQDAARHGVTYNTVGRMREARTEL